CRELESAARSGSRERCAARRARQGSEAARTSAGRIARDLTRRHMPSPSWGRLMRVTLLVALDLLREAASRRWFLALGAALTLILLFAALALRLEVVDGVLAATR